MKKISIAVFLLVSVALSACGSDFEFFPEYVDDVPPTVTGTIDNIKFSNTTTIYPSIPSNVTLIGTDLKSEPVTVLYTISGTFATYSTPFVISDKNWSLTVYGKDASGNASTPYTVKFIK